MDELWRAFYISVSLTGLYRGPGLGNFDPTLGCFLAAGGAVLCAERTEINTTFVSQSIALKGLHKTMLRKHFWKT
jgi:hypothetical protein